MSTAKKRTFSRITGLILLMPLLSSCTGIFSLAPRPDATLTSLYALATTDSTLADTVNPQVAELRAKQAQDLKNEIERLCGFTTAGTVVPSCVIDIEKAAKTPDAQALKATLQAIDKAPKESRDLLAKQAIELAKIAPDTDILEAHKSFINAHTALKSADITAAEELLKWEYGLRYAFQTAQAWRNDKALAEALRAQNNRITVLEQILESQADKTPLPIPEPGYVFKSAAAPFDYDSTMAMLTAVTTETTKAWSHAVGAGEDFNWRLVVVSGVVNASAHEL
ncbi:hypothetical protein [Corynebacterium caspium]|uniref:hypothetical protein n=1 Tax=Corynebacterium caspium TaxID=234828 RepID=UPI00037ADD6C|nr:hypothetical protein [Corynebacterium caspium]WKD59085.1 hypothetical protein CCASP_03405 [Corynebacterium caspium DSM 44850]